MICQWMIQTVSSSGLKTILVFPFAHVVAAVWEHPAGLHRRAVFPDKPAAPLPAAKHRLLLHLDPGRRPCKGWAQREYPSDKHKEPKWSSLTFSFLLQQPGEEQCRYMCQSDGENFIVSRGSQFVDGTRCESDSPPPFGSVAACLRGTCQVEMTQRDWTCRETDVILHSDSHLFKYAASFPSAVWLRWHAELGESEGCVRRVWWRWIDLQFDLWHLHRRSRQR